MRGLLELLDEHQESLEYDLLTLGLRLGWLGTSRLTWHELAIIVRQAPLSSALNRARRGEAAAYEVPEYLLVAILNTLRGMSWQLGGDKRAPKPEPFLPPGGEQTQPRVGDSMSIEEMDRRLARYRAAS